MNNLGTQICMKQFKLNKKSRRANKIYETPAPKDDMLCFGFLPMNNDSFLALTSTLLIMVICQEFEMNLDCFISLLFCHIFAAYLDYTKVLSLHLSFSI